MKSGHKHLVDLQQLTLREVKKILFRTKPPCPELVRLLAKDPRRGAEKLHRQALDFTDRHQQEGLRLQKLMTFDEECREVRKTPLAGVDESGRGPLAGPVVAAAVILPENKLIPGLSDSKMMKPVERKRVARTICTAVLSYSFGVASVEEIEKLNILQASFLAMRRALQKLALVPELVIVDGPYTIPSYSVAQKAVVKGDAKSASVAAASILAKVYRDQLMQELHQQYPQYGFDQHKGYGTYDHQQAIKMFGPCPVHRKIFVKKLIQPPKK